MIRAFAAFLAEPMAAHIGRHALAGPRVHADNTPMPMLSPEAAHVLLVRVRQASALRSWVLDLLRRVGARRAKAAVARKLAVVMHQIWRTGTAFCPAGPDARAAMAA